MDTRQGWNTLTFQSVHIPVQQAEREQLDEPPSVISFQSVQLSERGCSMQQTELYNA